MTKEKLMYWGCLFSNHEIRPIGWFDMTDWDVGVVAVEEQIDKVAKDVDAEPVHWIRGDCIDDLLDDLKLLKFCMKEKP